jgi:hypothetical protein
MTYSVLIAAPFLIAAIVMAFRFVGCTQDFGPFEQQPGDGTEVLKVHAVATLSGSGQLAAEAAFAPHKDPDNRDFAPQGVYSYDIPWWCIYIDLFLLGGGGGGSGGVPVGNGGLGGSWKTVTLWRGSGPQPPGVVQIPAATTSISITVGSGGAGGATPGPGGDTTATAAGMSQKTAHGGAAAANPDATGTGSNQSDPLNGTTKTGGADQTAYDAAGNAPGGGGAGGFFSGGGAGADGEAWVVARQT